MVASLIAPGGIRWKSNPTDSFAKDSIVTLRGPLLAQIFENIAVSYPFPEMNPVMGIEAGKVGSDSVYVTAMTVDWNNGDSIVTLVDGQLVIFEPNTKTPNRFSSYVPGESNRMHIDRLSMALKLSGGPFVNYHRVEVIGVVKGTASNA